MVVNLGRELAEHETLRAELKAVFADIDERDAAGHVRGDQQPARGAGGGDPGLYEDLTLAAALGMRISDMQQRLARFEARAEKKRALVTQVMGRAELRKLQEPDFTVSLQAVPPGLVVSDETAIPTAYWKPQPPKLDKKGLLACLNAGQVVPGAALGNGGTTISVRAR